MSTTHPSLMFLTRVPCSARHVRRARRVWLGVFGLLGVLALGGCGFHMQGASPLPNGIDAMYVSYNDDYRVGDPPLVETLRQRLRERKLLGDVDAPAQLDITDIENQQHLMSVSPIDGDAAEYELITTVTFDYSVNGASQLNGQRLSVTRDYSVNDTERLAAESERDDLLTSMHKELANLVLLRIAEINHKLVAKPAS